jgi:hypothetical protein
VTRCVNRLCKAKLEKGAIPRVCNDFCRDAAIGQAIAKVTAAKKRAAARAKNVVEREAKEARRESRRKKVEYYERDAGKQRELTQKACNKLVATLDRDLPCISCGRPRAIGKRRNASHLKSVGSNSFLRYSLLNIHDACMPCNQYKSGNIEGYKKGLVERYGPAMLEYLETAPRVREWSCEELIAMRAEFAAETRRIEKGLEPTKAWRELPPAQVTEIAA